MLNQMIPIKVLLDAIRATLEGISISATKDDAKVAAENYDVLLKTMGDRIPNEVHEEFITICQELDVCPDDWDM